MSNHRDLSELPETIDVRPHPRLLAVLGDIELPTWKCLAELIDNAFDDFLASPPIDETPTVEITLPARGSRRQDGQVWITDNGRGMSLEHLSKALSAGWTSNARYGKLGLFGMGFNIATARLGNATVVRTTRAGDTDWISVTLDLQALADSGAFLAPITREPKDDPSEHGTQIIISELKFEQHETLSRKQSLIRDSLGDIYSYLLRERGFYIFVDGIVVQAKRPCIWAKDRATVINGQRYPAYVEIDEPLSSLKSCNTCGRWHELGAMRCEECNSDDLEERERRINGWIGIQRYLHTKEYGIDFLRNGRKILIRDVRLFAWEDPNVPGEHPEVEYPIEIPYHAGRIVGEIHVDHIRVNYQKSAFEYDTRDWKKVVNILRGEGPLRPRLAAELGYATPNDSPIGRLFTGYRRNDPGLKYLTPGDGRTAIHEKSREWAKLFKKGDAEYQSDEHWYQAARQHDNPIVNIPVEASFANDAVEEDIRERLGIPEVGMVPQTAIGTSTARETEEDKQIRYRDSGYKLPDLCGSYALPDFGSAMNVTVYALDGTEITDSTGVPVPVYVRQQRGAEVQVFVDVNHSLFTEFGADVRDITVMEIVEHIRVRRGSSTSLSAMVAEIKNRCLPDQRVTPDALAIIALALLDRIREAMFPVVAGNGEGFWGFVSTNDRSEGERRFAVDGVEMDWEEAKATGAWIRYVPASALSRLVQQRPTEFLDGKVFKSGYSTFDDSHARALAANRVVSYFNDVGLLAERRIRRQPDELARGRLSCRLLQAELSSPEAEPHD